MAICHKQILSPGRKISPEGDDMKTGRKLTEIDPAGVAVLLGLTVGLGIAVHESFFLVAAMITLGVVIATTGHAIHIHTDTERLAHQH